MSILKAVFAVQAAIAQAGLAPLSNDSPIDQESGYAHLQISFSKPLFINLANLQSSSKDRILSDGFIMLENGNLVDSVALKQAGGLSGRSATVCTFEIEPSKLRSALAQGSLSIPSSLSIYRVQTSGNKDKNGEYLFTDLLFQYPPTNIPQ